MILTDSAFWEFASYVVTVVGLPGAICVYIIEQRKQRANEESEIQQTLSNSYTEFLKLVLAYPELRLLSGRHTPNVGPADEERIRALYSILVALFERAFVLTWSPRMNKRRQQYFLTWEDLMREWCGRDDFRDLLPELLVGEDEEFVAYISQLAKTVSSGH